MASLFFAPAARAQQQEKGFLDRIDHPDRTLHFDPSDKAFSTSSSVAGRSATVRPFSFKRAGAYEGRDGTYHARAFNGGASNFRVQDYATRNALGSGKGYAQTDKTYGTKDVDVKENSAANKSAPIREYVPGSKPFLGRGRRQDDIDELSKQKNLTIDQVRELLNKNK